jgi:putative heme-binding domain-containing protein
MTDLDIAPDGMQFRPTFFAPQNHSATSVASIAGLLVLFRPYCQFERLRRIARSSDAVALLRSSPRFVAIEVSMKRLVRSLDNRHLPHHSPSRSPRRSPRASLMLAILAAAALLWAALPSTPLHAQEAQWIWSQDHKKESVPRVACHFRKSFTMSNPESGQILLAADDEYELYVNGRRVGAGETSKKMAKYDITEYLARGTNLVAVKVTNTTGSTGALAARVLVKQRGGQWTSHGTDASWKTSLSPFAFWNLAIYNDARWDAAQTFGQLGRTPPWDRAEAVAVEQTQSYQRFEVAEEFQVQQIVDEEKTGSLIAMTFNEFGQIIASREGGPLLLIVDSNRDQVPDQVRVYCDQVKNCQGILALNGEVYVTGEGPEGTALYRLADKNRDGKLEDVRALVKFKGEMGEHGPHGLQLGPDGMIYVVVGNHSSPEQEYDPDSPHRDYYEGDLVGPKYEDPGGHAVGIKAPGGVVIRTDIDGEVVHLVAGGLRNAYDLAFNREGDLFVHDSDMEADEGNTWYRPTRLCQIIPGGEYGWRSGWSKWPEYFVDSLPAVLDTGRGSPTGAVSYNHHMFPVRFHDAMFLADWSEGRILAVHLKQSGGSYTANSEVFLQGDPLNVTDLAVGPDGGLYFCTGGRGTGGGVYRITWKGTVPAAVRALGEGLTAVIRQPHLQSAWSRQQIAALKNQYADKWDVTLIGVARSTANPSYYRTRALDLMQLFGPLPTAELLISLSKDKNEAVRAKVAELMGIHATDATRTALVALLDDGDRTVRRKAIEALARAGQSAPLDKLTRSLESDDRYEAWAARRLLERLPEQKWRELVLTTDNHRVFIEGALALVIAHPEKQNSLDVLERSRQLIAGFVSDRDFIDMLRVMQVAMQRGGVTAGDVPQLRAALAQEFPAGHATMNREVVRLLAYLQVDSITDRYVAYLKSDVPEVEKLHLALHLRFIETGWSPEQKLEVMKYYETAGKRKGGGSYPFYVMNVARDFAKSLDGEDSLLVLEHGAEWPTAAMGALYKLPPQLDDGLFAMLSKLDREIADRTGDPEQRLKVGIIAVLARSADEKSLAYLREIWQRDPERRTAAAMGMAQSPGGENWPFLVRSLPVLDGGVAREVLVKLLTVDQAPEDPEFVRQVILRGLTLKENGAKDAIELLEYWTGVKPSSDGDSWDKALAAWQKWFAETYPDRLPAKLPEPAKESKWAFAELLEYLGGSEAAKGTAEKGAAAFVKADCIKCHRFGDKGESMGPDLTSISRRFMKKEILESLVYPSHVISDQYASKTVVTSSGRKLTGIVAAGSQGEIIVLQPNGEKVSVIESDIDEIVASKISAMPEGLLDKLTLEEIADLFVYLTTTPTANLTRRPIRIGDTPPK